ncbi:hypothetical protein CLV90_3194 [Maribacter spongiicola]|uniref:Uncharacterized protein n=1 Tax=Maribacter spongiicola TaxID=1206753 RepID=A0A4R7JUE8_9FLAO|nr:hypothetical protein [Maribacter spongiicola]TDT41961.1 hypothetical protein CLV90_3194 [Maribacter spongiicola]
MKKLYFLILLLISLDGNSQHKNNDSIPAKKYVQELTELTFNLDGKIYPVYRSRRKNKVYKNGKEILNHVSYYIMRVDDVTGEEYMQLLEMED